MTVALSLALVFNALSLVLFVRPVSAVALTTMTAVMSRQDADVDTSFEISFTSPTGFTATPDDLTLTFAADFDLTSILITDVDLAVDGDDKTLAASPAAAVWGYVLAGQVMTFTTADGYVIGASEPFVVQIGTEFAAAAVNEVNNPSTAGAYAIDVDVDSGTDTGSMNVPILDDDFVTINAIVQSNIWFDLDIDDEIVALHHDESAAPYSIDLQTLIFTSVTDEDTSSVEEIYVDLSTNATGGAVIEFYSANTSLDSASTLDTIESATETLTINTTDGGYGVFAELVGTGFDTGDFNVDATYADPGADAVIVVPSAWDTIFDTGSGVVQGGDGRINVRAISGTQTAAANDYTDTLYFRATATF